MALQSLLANKLRSALTLLGVVIGVAAVIAVVTFVSGINGYVAERIFRLGADVFIIGKTSGVITNIDQYLEQNKRKNLALEDYQAVLQGCKNCTYVGATTFNGNGHIRYAEQSSTDTWVRGFTPSMATITDLNLVAGRMFNQNDVERAAAVAIIGNDIVENLLPG